MATYIITVQNDMRQQLVFHANSVSEALDKAKIAYKESMVTADDNNGEQRNKPLSQHLQTIKTKRQHPSYLDVKEYEQDKEKIKIQAFNDLLAEIPD